MVVMLGGGTTLVEKEVALLWQRRRWERRWRRDGVGGVLVEVGNGGDGEGGGGDD